MEGRGISRLDSEHGTRMRGGTAGVGLSIQGVQE